MAVCVVLFWLVSTGWLLRSIWFEEESNFEPVATEEALGRFFRWNDQSTLVVLDNGVRIGQMIVSGFEGEDRRAGEFNRSLSTQGNLDEIKAVKGQPSRENLAGSTWRLTADFDEEFELKEFATVLWIPRQTLDIRMELTSESRELAALVTMGEVEMLKVGELSDKGESGRKRRSKNGGDDEAPPALQMPPAAAAGWLPGGAMLGDENAWKPDIKASRGSMEVAGGLQPVYLVEIAFGDQGPPIKLYLSEAGEPWRIDSGWGFEAVAEVLIPASALSR